LDWIVKNASSIRLVSFDTAFWVLSLNETKISRRCTQINADGIEWNADSADARRSVKIRAIRVIRVPRRDCGDLLPWYKINKQQTCTKRQEFVSVSISSRLLSMFLHFFILLYLLLCAFLYQEYLAEYHVS